MFYRLTLVDIPVDILPKMKIGICLIFSSLAVMFSGMIGAGIWQWAVDIKAKSLLESTPLFLQVMIIGGLAGFISFLLLTLVLMPIFYDSWRLWKYFRRQEVRS
jgi:hypothetical protein